MPDVHPLVVRGLTHRFGAQPTFRDVSLTVETGAIVAVLGPSGSGKTTLLRAVAGFAEPCGGTIEIRGTPVWREERSLVPAERRRIGIVFQDYALFPQMSVSRNIAFGIGAAGDRAARVGALLEAIGLPGYEDRLPAELSGGQQQRVAIARALAPRPDLMLLDEPFANLDASRRSRLIGELRAMLAAERASAMLVTHDRAEALALADRVAILGLTDDGGRILQEGTPEEVYDTPADAQVAGITGEAQLVAGVGRGDHAETPLGHLPLRGELRGPLHVLVRPEQVGWQGGAGDCRVLQRQYCGRVYRVQLATPAGPLMGEFDRRAAPAVDASGHVVVEGPCAAFARSTNMKAGS